MSQRLSFNLFSEPTIFPDDHVGGAAGRRTAIDSGTSGKPADPSHITFDDFDNPYSIINLYPYIFLVLLDVVFICLICKNSRHKLITVIGSLYFSILLLAVALDMYVDITSLQICDTPWICYEGEDGMLEYSSNFYISKGECFDRVNSGYDYADNHRDPDEEEWSCHDSKYGCCYVDERCNIAVKNDYTYSQFINNLNNTHGSRMILPLAKKDQTGSNCPLISDLIEDEINHEKMSGLKIWFGSLVLKVGVFVSIIFCMNPDETGYKQQRNPPGDVDEP
tara:strand:+ start:10254 stop:11090 length:837 start_codon:yes stop_codon:yes gene_type:complete